MSHPTDSKPAVKDDAADPSRVLPRLQSIREVVQMAGEFNVLASPGKPPYRAKIGGSFTAARVTNRSIHVIGEFRFDAFNAPEQTVGPPSPEEAEGTQFVVVKATFLIDYILDEGEVPSDADAQAFARTNGAFNLHPYWREYVRDCLGRAGLPTYQIPLLNPQRMPKAREQHASTSPDRGRDGT